jgi:hypothetical protein
MRRVPERGTLGVDWPVAQFPRAELYFGHRITMVKIRGPNLGAIEDGVPFTGIIGPRYLRELYVNREEKKRGEGSIDFGPLEARVGPKVLIWGNIMGIYIHGK